MQSTYPTHNCGCDFCTSRRSVNAKKLAVSQAAFQHSGVMQRNGCDCACHTAGQAGATTFDPAYPEPVNQTALNASRGRNGVPGGNQYTIRNGTTRAGASQNNGNAASAPETAEERQAREVAELDALERLLMLEYKARTKAAMEAERLKGNATGGTARRPQPLPEGYMSSSMADKADSGTWGRSGPGVGAGSYGPGVATIHEAYVAAQDCLAEPPAQCHASHLLQDTMDDVRKVTFDPVNAGNRRALQQLLHQHGMAETPTGEAGAGTGKAASGTEHNAFGSSLAQIRTSYAHPRGAGVVWVPKAQSSSKQVTPNDTNVLSTQGKAPAALSPGAAAAIAAQEKHVTYAA